MCAFLALSEKEGRGIVGRGSKTMSIRDIVAMGAVGWALIFPPLVGSQVDIGAPVQEWQVR